MDIKINILELSKTFDKEVCSGQLDITVNTYQLIKEVSTGQLDRDVSIGQLYREVRTGQLKYI